MDTCELIWMNGEDHGTGLVAHGGAGFLRSFRRLFGKGPVEGSERAFVPSSARIGSTSYDTYIV